MCNLRDPYSERYMRRDLSSALPGGAVVVNTVWHYVGTPRFLLSTPLRTTDTETSVTELLSRNLTGQLTLWL